MTDTYTQVITTMGTAAGVACFIMLLRPNEKTLAVVAALLVLAVGLGAIAYLEKAL